MPSDLDCNVNVIAKGFCFVLNAHIAPSLFRISTYCLLLLFGFYHIEQVATFVVLPWLTLFVPAFSNVVGCST